MFKRQKILLGVLAEAPETPTRTQLMQWLFLIGQETCIASEDAFYGFVPYERGPFSFTADRDIQGLARSGHLSETGGLFHPGVRGASAIMRSLPRKFQEAITEIILRYGHCTERMLSDDLCKRYPWLASQCERDGSSADAGKARGVVYTAGYEGESVDCFLRKLVMADIMRVVDVRANPVSRKYGFAGKTLEGLCERVGIEYLHLPKLGIPRSYRTRLDTFEDYQALMRTYEDSILPTASAARSKAAHLVEEASSALVCFEADVRCCHRGRLAEALSADTGMPVAHL